MGDYSKNIADFLNFLRDSERGLKIAHTTNIETDQKTQDVLHSLELEPHNAVAMMKMAKLLKEIRKERRIAKNEYTLLFPVCQWVAQNKETIKSLERLLGEERKIENGIIARIYTPRTDIMNKIKVEEDCG